MTTPPTPPNPNAPTSKTARTAADPTHRLDSQFLSGNSLESDMTGKTITGASGANYLIERLLADGEGGYGIVYRARYVRSTIEPKITIPNYVAIKFLKEGTHSDAEREYKRALAFKESKHVVTPLDHSNKGPYLFIAMEYLEGENLDDLVKKTGPLDSQMLAALLFAFGDYIKRGDRLPKADKGYHGDISARNVRWTEDDGGNRRFVLLDFGHGHRNVTQTPGALKPAYYLTPEALKTTKELPANPISQDVHLIGQTILYALTGVRPSNGNDATKPAAVQELKKLHKQIPSKELTPLLKGMLEFDITKRSSPTTLQHALPVLARRFAESEYKTLKLRDQARRKEKIKDSFFLSLPIAGALLLAVVLIGELLLDQPFGSVRDPFSLASWLGLLSMLLLLTTGVIVFIGSTFWRVGLIVSLLAVLLLFEFLFHYLVNSTEHEGSEPAPSQENSATAPPSSEPLETSAADTTTPPADDPSHAADTGEPVDTAEPDVVNSKSDEVLLEECAIRLGDSCLDFSSKGDRSLVPESQDNIPPEGLLINWTSLRPEDCFTEGEDYQVILLDCDTPHFEQVLAIGTLSGAREDVGSIADLGHDYCRSYTSRQGYLTTTTTAGRWVTKTPSADAWQAGLRNVVCTLQFEDEVTGFHLSAWLEDVA